MGEAKRRGSFEARREESKARIATAIVNKDVSREAYAVGRAFGRRRGGGRLLQAGVAGVVAGVLGGARKHGRGAAVESNSVNGEVRHV